MKTFSKKELRSYDGKKGVAYIAFRGNVYDVSSSYHWRGGIHHVAHTAGVDLTEALGRAPHGAGLLEKFPVVGELID